MLTEKIYLISWKIRLCSTHSNWRVEWELALEIKVVIWKEVPHPPPPATLILKLWRQFWWCFDGSDINIFLLCLILQDHDAIHSSVKMIIWTICRFGPCTCSEPFCKSVGGGKADIISCAYGLLLALLSRLIFSERAEAENHTWHKPWGFLSFHKIQFPTEFILKQI